MGTGSGWRLDGLGEQGLAKRPSSYKSKSLASILQAESPQDPLSAPLPDHLLATVWERCQGWQSVPSTGFVCPGLGGVGEGLSKDSGLIRICPGIDVEGWVWNRQSSTYVLQCEPACLSSTVPWVDGCQPAGPCPTSWGTASSPRTACSCVCGRDPLGQPGR